MKFSFINAGLNEGPLRNETARGVASFPPLGILYLAAFLREDGVELSVLDQSSKNFTTEEVVKWISKEDPDILGLSAISSSGRTAATISKRAKELKPNIVTVMGNMYASLNPDRVLKKYPSVDIVVRGEGERTTADLVNKIENNGDLREVNGITFRKDGTTISTPDRPLIDDLDSIPFPARELIDSEYHCTIAGANAAPRKFTSFLSSRGCVYRCRFCSCSQFAKNRWRARSVKNTIEELGKLEGDGYRQIIFTDDSFTTNKKRVIDICQEMRRERMDLEFICEGRVDNCSHEMFSEMAKAGCKMLYFGIENANQRILDYYRKQTTPQQSENAVRTARNAGIDVIVGSFIAGAPDETRDEITNTIEFSKRIPIDIPQFNILCTYPGMEIWNELSASGILNEEEYWEMGVQIPTICPNSVPLPEIRRMLNEGLYDFLKRPGFLLKELAMTLKSGYRLNTILRNISRINEIRENLHNIN